MDLVYNQWNGVKILLRCVTTFHFGIWSLDTLLLELSKRVTQPSPTHYGLASEPTQRNSLIMSSRNLSSARPTTSWWVKWVASLN